MQAQAQSGVPATQNNTEHRSLVGYKVRLKSGLKDGDVMVGYQRDGICYLAPLKTKNHITAETFKALRHGLVVVSDRKVDPATLPTHEAGEKACYHVIGFGGMTELVGISFPEDQFELVTERH